MRASRANGRDWMIDQAAVELYGVTEGEPESAIDRTQHEERARRDLEEHLRRLADEIDQTAARTEPNPWLKPWDRGYESPTLIALRRATDAPGPSRAVDAGAILRRMESRLA